MPAAAATEDEEPGKAQQKGPVRAQLLSGSVAEHTDVADHAGYASAKSRGAAEA